MVLPLLVIVLLPKVINPSDPEMRRVFIPKSKIFTGVCVIIKYVSLNILFYLKEMEQSMNMLNPNPELPDVSELMTKFFSPPKSQKKPGGGTRVLKGGGPKRR